MKPKIQRLLKQRIRKTCTTRIHRSLLQKMLYYQLRNPLPLWILIPQTLQKHLILLKQNRLLMLYRQMQLIPTQQSPILMASS